MSTQNEGDKSAIMQQRLAQWTNIIELGRKILLEGNLTIEISEQMDEIMVGFILSITKTAKYIKHYV